MYAECLAEEHEEAAVLRRAARLGAQSHAQDLECQQDLAYEEAINVSDCR